MALGLFKIFLQSNNLVTRILETYSGKGQIFSFKQVFHVNIFYSTYNFHNKLSKCKTAEMVKKMVMGKRVLKGMIQFHTFGKVTKVNMNLNVTKH